MAVTDDDDQGGGGLSYDDDSEEVTGGEGDLKKVTSFMNKSTEDQTTPNSYYYQIKSKSLSYKIIYKYI